MRFIFILFLCFSGLTANSQTSNLNEDHLIDRMYNLFTSTLKDKYKISDEQKLYTLFIAEYLIKQQDFKITVKRNKLIKINKKLCKRDSTHFYHFYIDVINLAENENLKEKAKEVESLYPKKRITVAKAKSDFNEHDVSFYNFPNVRINKYDNTDSFFSKEKEYLRTVKIARELMDTWTQVSFKKFASLLAINNKAFYIDALKDKKEREVVAVIFWKLLCQQTGKDIASNCFNPYKHLSLN